MREQVGYDSEDILSSNKFDAGQLIVWDRFHDHRAKECRCQAWSGIAIGFRAISTQAKDISHSAL